VGHNGDRYPGEHEAIVPRELWEQAHAVLEKHRGPQRVRTRNETPALLKGIIRCAHCDCAMGPAFTRRRGRIYGYYLCVHAAKRGHRTCPTRSLSVGEIDRVVVEQLRSLLRTPEVLARSCQMAESKLRRREMLRALAALDESWDQLPPAEQERIVQSLVTRVDIHPDRADLQISTAGLVALIADPTQHIRTREAAV